MPKYDPQKHHRRSIRLPEYDYTQPGAYFITICTWQRRALFGMIVNGTMRLNAAGQIVKAEWQRLASRFANIHLDSFVVMPDHVHGIIVIDDPPVRATRPRPDRLLPGKEPEIKQAPGVRATRNLPDKLLSGKEMEAKYAPSGIEGSPRQADSPPGSEPETNHAPADIEGSPRLESSPQRPKGPPSGSLGAMIGQFKSRATKRIWALPEHDHSPVWQRNYYERIIRNQAAWERIRAYIQANPQLWTEDQLHPASRPIKQNRENK